VFSPSGLLHHLHHLHHLSPPSPPSLTLLQPQLQLLGGVSFHSLYSHCSLFCLVLLPVQGLGFRVSGLGFRA
jgi:hypothetical protein